MPSLANKVDVANLVKYDLPFESGFVTRYSAASYFTKDPFGKVFVQGCVASSVLLSGINKLATLPKRVKPSTMTASIALMKPMSSAIVFIGWVECSTTGDINLVFLPTPQTDKTADLIIFQLKFSI